MPEMYEIYSCYSSNYDELVAHEDADGNFRRELLSLCDWKDKTIFEAGAGTGRVTAIYAQFARKIVASDRSSHMINQAKNNLSAYLDKITFETKDNLTLSELALKADIFIEGWSFGHAVCDVPLDEVEAVTDKLIFQSSKLTKADGKTILIETLGTGSQEPLAPAENLRRFYELLETKYSFKRNVVRTDYLFTSVEEASRICGFFFGKEMGKNIKAKNSKKVPEYTGIWIK